MRIPIEPIDSAPATSRPMLADLQARSLVSGHLLNMHAQMGHSPAALAGYLGIRRALEEHSTFDLKTRTALMLAISGVTEAAYGRALHQKLALRAGWTPPQVADIQAGTFTDDGKLAPLLGVIRQVAAGHGQVRDDAWQAAQEVGWTDSDLVEAFANLALTLFVDAFVLFARTPLDIGAHTGQAPMPT